VLHEAVDVVVKLRAVGSSTIGDSKWLALYGERYSSEDEAASAGNHWRDAFERALAAFRVAADFGERNTDGWLHPRMLAIASEASGGPVLNDVHGLMVIPADQNVSLFRGSASGFATQSVEALRLTLASGLNRRRHAQQRLAFDLYSAGLMAQSVDAKFLLLIAAVESLMTEFNRAAEVQILVDALVLKVTQATIDAVEKERLTSAVSRLKVASFGQQGTQLALSLGDREYAGDSAVKFFKRCYRIRGRVTHGSATRPSQEDLTAITGGLTQFVGDLLAGPDLVDELIDRGRNARP
jgi:hypothetical protein